MTKDEALKLALQLVSNLRTHSWTVADEQLVITAIKEALTQPEPEYLAFMDTPQRTWVGLTDEEIWVLTSEYNDYDQHGEYFEAVFIGKPTSKQIQKHCHVTEQGAIHILNGGGRVKYEDQWYNLRKEKAAHGIKGEA